MRILFVDDDPENVNGLARVLREALGAGSEILVATTVEDALAALHGPSPPFDILVTDLFIPLGTSVRGVLGPRARRIAGTEQDIQHLGGLVLLDEIDRLAAKPIVLAHTACTDPVLTSLLGERVHARVRKPAPFEVLLNAILDVVKDREAADRWA
ncbi:MAG: response regulator [Myxococcales bacterium]|nr:response regulator [Myxococcales bacterium]